MAAKKATETAITVPTDALAIYPVLDPTQAGDIMELISGNLGPGGVDISNLDHIVVPPGGGKAFNLSDGVATELRGIIVLAPTQNGYWAQSMEEAPNAPPVCVSSDGQTGTGTPGGNCSVCPMKEWGSASKGNGKACRDMRPIFLLQEGDFLPLVIQTPRMSIKPLAEYFAQLTRKGIPYYAAVTSIGLRQEQKPGTPVYSALTFELLDVIPRDRREPLRAYQKALAAHATKPEAPRSETAAQGPSAANEPPLDPAGFDPWAD